MPCRSGIKVVPKATNNAVMDKPSTIIDLSGDHPYLLREGALSAEEIGEVLGVSADSLRTRPQG